MLASHAVSVRPWARVVSVAAWLAACSSDAGPAPLSGEETDQLFSAEDPLRELAADTRTWPTDLAAFEARFGVGRRCARQDSREIYTDEEHSSRYGGHQRRTDALLPRVTLTGCAATRESFSLLVAETSPAQSGVADSSATDPIATSPVEVMSFEPDTGRYGFFELYEKDGVRTVVRIERAEDGSVVEHEKREDAPLVSRTAADLRCFGCHVHGEPMLLEMSDPWFGWISANKLQTVRRDYTGHTAELVAESRLPDGSRTSLASALEVTVRQGIARMTSALDASVPSRMRSEAARALFCPTTFNFATRGGSYPDALFVDPQLLRRLGLGIQPIQTGTAAALQVAVRAHVDERLEDRLQEAGFVSREMVLALRAFDDEHDVSEARCALAAALPSDWIDATAERRNAAIAALLLERTVEDGSPRAQLVRTLAAGGAPDAALRERYGQDLLARVAARGATLDQWLPAEIERRAQRAAELFDTLENPTPMP